MVWQIIREHPKRTFGWVAVAVLITLCLYYGMRERETSGKGDQENLVRKWQKCVKLHETITNVTTADEYKQFDFDPEWMASKSFWDSSLQDRYEQFKANKTKPNLKVILVPFSHNDPGWLKTFTDYFKDDTRHILDSVITKMEEYRDMTFVWSEISFLQLWWDQAPSAKKRSLKKLIKSGRFEIVTGGWVMADEANTHVYGLINQLIEGHQWLRENLNCTPTTGFSIDPFGQGSTLPYLMAASGFDGAIIQRVHFAWKQFLAKKQYGDFYWTPYWNDGTGSESRTLLTHNMPFDIYSIQGSCGPYPEICKKFNFPEFDVSNGWGVFPPKRGTIQIVDGIQEKADLLVEQYAMAGSLFPHNIALMPLGGDFEYKTNGSIDVRYTNYKKLADYVNSNPKRYNNTHISFGLPRDYFAEIKKRHTAYPHLKGDFFPYADIFSTGRPGYWSGYFTTRPMYKMLDRDLEHHLRSAEILFTVALNRAKQFKRSHPVRFHEKYYEKLILARRNLGLFQHHDGITGTAKNAVMIDYGQRLFKSLQDSIQLQKNSIEFLLQNSTEKQNFISSETERTRFDDLPKKISIEINQNLNSAEIILYNSLAQERIELISLRTTSPNVKLIDHQGKGVKIQINPNWNFTHGTDGEPVNFQSSINISKNEFELQFVAKLPPLALVKYTLKYSASQDKAEKASTMATIHSNGENATAAPFQYNSLKSMNIEVENRLLRIVCDGTSGLLKSIGHKNKNETVECGLNFAAYRSSQFHSGAYLFETDETSPVQEMLDSYNDEKVIFMISGPLTTDVTVVYGNFLTHTIRIFSTGTSLDSGIFIVNHMDYHVSTRTDNTEMFMRFSTNIMNGADPVFYSDQNGFQYLRRELVHGVGIEGNYYPITSGAFIQDEEHRLTLLTTHAQGAASHKLGNLEVMLDRRTIRDDNRGLDEGITDSRLTHQTYWLILEEFDASQKQSATDKEREYETPSHFVNQLTNMHNYPVNIFIVDAADQDVSNPLELDSLVSLIDVKFPCDVHLSTLRTQSEPNWPIFPSRTALLMLHRQSSTCKVKDIGFACENNQGFLAKSSNLAKDLPLDSVELVSLTGMKSIATIKSFDQIFIKPMDIVTLNLTFSN